MLAHKVVDPLLTLLASSLERLFQDLFDLFEYNLPDVIQ
jgi:hypothetical protein